MSQKRARFIVLSSIVLMVLLVVPSFNDPTNIPKYSVLLLASVLGIFVLGEPRCQIFVKENWKIWLPVLFFIITMLVMAILTEQKNQAFFGNYGRNNGFFQYFGLSVLFLLTAFSFNFETLKKYFDLLIILGLIVTFYGYMQYLGLDFIDYETLNAPIIATFGNSNFASAFMGLSGICLLWKITDIKLIWARVLLAVLLIGQILVIYISQSSQGIFVIMVGGLIFLGLRYFTHSKRYGYSYFFVLIVSAFAATMGLFQIGPLTKFVYQESTTFRGDYFRAAWNMFKNKPLTGIGIDSFGDNYRSYRDVDAALRVGPNVLVDYAHNSFLQFLSTGGIFLFLSYFSFILFTAAAVIKGLRKLQGAEKNVFSVLVALWIGYLLQSQVSIDQITIAAVGWVTAGAIVSKGFNVDSRFIEARRSELKGQKVKRVTSKTTFASAALTSVLIFAYFLKFTPIWEAEIKIWKSRTLVAGSNDPVSLSIKEDLALEAVRLQPYEEKYQFLAADVALVTGNLEMARRQLKSVLNLNSKSFESLVYLADLYEYSEDFNEAVKLRILASNIDPFDSVNWLKLGKDLAFLKDFQALNKVIELVAPLAGKSTIADDLKALLPTVPTS